MYILLFLFIDGNRFFSNEAAAALAERVARDFFRRPQADEDRARQQRNHVQQHVLEPIEIVGRCPQVFRSAVLGHVFDPVNGVFEWRQWVVLENGRRLFGVFHVSATRGEKKNEIYNGNTKFYFRHSDLGRHRVST